MAVSAELAADPLAELRRHARLMQILSEVSRAALEEDDLGRLMHRVVDYVADRLDVTVASILLLDDAGERFVDEVYAGDLQLGKPYGAEEWPVSVGVCGRCARSGEPQLIADVHADPDYVPGHPDVRAEYITPIRYRGRILGVLNLESCRADAFGEEERAAFDAIALQVAGSIHLASVNRRLEEANRELERVSQLDGLTGVGNRRTFDAAFEREWRRALRCHEWVSVLLADLDHFKTINDNGGHLFGDECLRRAANVFAGVARRSADVVARYGGEEFAILLPGAPPAAAVAIAEAARQGVAALELDGRWDGGSLTVSLGVASTRPHAVASAGQRCEAAALLTAADRALYDAKRAGRNRTVAVVLGDA
jgi:diguanylate cyclase (GGDEF)-like protein